MSDGLDVIVLDDDPGISQVLKELIESFYSWAKWSASRKRKRPSTTA